MCWLDSWGGTSTGHESGSVGSEGREKRSQIQSGWINVQSRLRCLRKMHSHATSIGRGS